MTRTTRAERMTHPRAAQAVMMLAEASGGCIRPVQLRRTDVQTGQVEQVLVPCGHTLATVCPSCAERARNLGTVVAPIATSVLAARDDLKKSRRCG